MGFIEEAKRLIEKIGCFENDEAAKARCALPSGCYFLEEDAVLCTPRDRGDSRYPYAADGRVLWAHSSGYIAIEESSFNIFLPAHEGREPNLAFFAGIKKGEMYQPLSLTGTPEFDRGKRYTVFTPHAVYYFTFYENLIFAVRAFMGKDKQAVFSSAVFNEGQTDIQLYLSAYFDCLLRHDEVEYIESKWYKSCAIRENGALIKSTEYFGRGDCVTHNALIRRNAPKGAQCRVAVCKTDFTGGLNRGLYASRALTTGKFSAERTYCEFAEKPVYADMLLFSLSAGESRRADYIFTIDGDEASAFAREKEGNIQTIADSAFDMLVKEDKNALAGGERFKAQFQYMRGTAFKEETLNHFIASVVRQTEFCAKAKNFAGTYLGTRDIFQQVEAALMWMPVGCKKKILEAVSFIAENGRPPRQFSYPAYPGAVPRMDLRKYIDQGLWIIETVYVYLAFTDDFAILNETCGYYKIEEYSVSLSDKKDTLAEHLIVIADYLLEQIDKETGCLRALYGDWNDALDGLGRTEKPGKEFGSGVSVMASLQLYAVLNKLAEMLLNTNFGKASARYADAAEKLMVSLEKHAVVKNKKGERKILHGWGDDKSFFVGSFCDNDCKSRDSATSNAFWVLSGAIERDVSLKEDILKSFARLDSKYGLMTFRPGFAAENTEVGRICRLPLGTAENGATYIHAALFAVWAMFKMNESEQAWKQLEKLLPITHGYISTSPFVMPNSYAYNPEKGIDGESMGDWFTGSGCVLVKLMARCVFGVEPDLDSVTLRPAAHFPSEKARTEISVKNCKLFVTYSNVGAGKRRFFIDGQEIDSKTDTFGLPYIRLKKEELTDGMEIFIED